MYTSRSGIADSQDNYISCVVDTTSFQKRLNRFTVSPAMIKSYLHMLINSWNDQFLNFHHYDGYKMVPHC